MDSEVEFPLKPDMRPICKILLIFLAVNLSFAAHSQFQQELFSLEEDSLNAVNRLNLQLNASGFFNNNEFFGGDIEGYTLTGSYFQPSLIYSFNERFSLRGGIHLLKYNGQEDFTQVSPVFAIHYKVMPELELTLGTFNQGANLGLPEPLYKFENQFTDLTGNGIFIRKTGEIWNSVTWLNWITFIEPGDPFKEEFIFGHSGDISIYSDEENSLKIPLYLLVNHRGGQINNNNDPVETRADLGSGIRWLRELDFLFFDELEVLGNLYHEEGAGNNTNGNALLGFAQLKGTLFSLGAGYFYEKNWESILGEPLLFTYNSLAQNDMPGKSVILVKAGLGKRITPTSSFTIRFEGYYDTELQKFQYTYGLHIILNEWIKILRD